MISRNKEINVEVREHLRGGAGQVSQLKLLKENLVPNCRSCSVQTIAKGATIGYHVHENESEIYYVLKGCASFNDNGKTFLLYEGDCGITPPGSGHAVANAGSEDLILLSTIIINT